MNYKENLKSNFSDKYLLIQSGLLVVLSFIIFLGRFPIKTSATQDYILAVILFMLGLFILCRQTKHIVWFLLGGILITISFNIPFESIELNLINISKLLLWGICLLYSIYYSYIESGKEYVTFKNSEEKIKKLESDIKDLNDKIRDKNEKLIILTSEINTLKGNNFELSKNFEDEKKITRFQNNEIEEKNKKLYESQLVILFTVALQNGENGLNHFGLHYLQGNWDSPLSDFIGETNGTFWLLELKRRVKDIPSELKKGIRKKQMTALLADNTGYKEIANKCHWMGWGKEDLEKNTTLTFYPYWDSLSGIDINKTIKLTDFVSRAYSDDYPIGENQELFQKYVEFLLKSGECDGGTDIDKLSVIIYYRAKSGKLFSKQTTLFEIRQEYMEHRLSIEHQYKNQLEQNRHKGWDMSR